MFLLLLRCLLPHVYAGFTLVNSTPDVTVQSRQKELTNLEKLEILLFIRTTLTTLCSKHSWISDM
jgi:hypothetical protein